MRWAHTGINWRWVKPGTWRSVSGVTGMLWSGGWRLAGPTKVPAISMRGMFLFDHSERKYFRIRTIRTLNFRLQNPEIYTYALFDNKTNPPTRDGRLGRLVCASAGMSALP